MAILKIRDDNGNIIEIPAIRGEPGKDGYTPIKGKDYYTDTDKQEIKNHIDVTIDDAIDKYFEENPPVTDLTGYATEDWVEKKGYTTVEDVDNTVISLVPDKVKEALSPYGGLRLGDWTHTSSIGLQFDYQTIDFGGNRMHVATSGPTVEYEIAVTGDNPVSLIFNNTEGSLYLKNNNGLTKLGVSQTSSITMTDDGDGNVFIGMSPTPEGGNN